MRTNGLRIEHVENLTVIIEPKRRHIPFTLCILAEPPTEQDLPIQGEDPLATFNMTDTQQRRFSIASIKDRRGNDATVQGVPSWSSDNPAIATVEAEEDGMAAVVKAAGAIGVAIITVEADADLGPDEKEITGSFDVDVGVSQATGFGFEAEEPTEQSL